MKSAAYATGAAFSTHVDGVEEDLRSKTVGLGLCFIFVNALTYMPVKIRKVMRSGVVNDSSSGYVNYPKTIILPSAQIGASSGEIFFTDFDISHLLELTR